MKRTGLALLMYILIAGVNHGAAARDVTDAFVDGLKVCADVVDGEDLSSIATEAGFTKTPLLAGSFQSDGVRLFQLERVNQCHVQTAKQPAVLSEFYAVLNSMAADKAGQLRRISWAETRRRPILNDMYSVWSWEQVVKGGVLGFEVRELPGAKSNRPGEQALTATVSFTKGAKIDAPAQTVSVVPGSFDKIIVTGIDICARMMLNEPYASLVGTSGFKVENANLVRRVGEKFVTIERSGSSPCQVFVNGRPDDHNAVDAAVVKTVATRAPAFAVAEANRLVSIPGLGSEYDNHVTSFVRNVGRESALIRLQRNKAAEEDQPIDRYSYVALVDRFLSRSIDIGENGPMYVAILEAMMACDTISQPSEVAPMASKLGHVANSVGDLMRRVLDKGEVKIGWDQNNARCSLSVYATQNDDTNVFAAAIGWLKTGNPKVMKLKSLVPKSESGWTWKTSQFRGQVGGRMKDVMVNLYEGAQFPAANGPRFMIWIEPARL